MFQNLLTLIVPLSKYNVLKIKVIFWYFKQEYVKSLIMPKKYNFCKIKQRENRSITLMTGHGQNVIPTHYKPKYTL